MAGSDVSVVSVSIPLTVLCAIVSHVSVFFPCPPPSFFSCYLCSGLVTFFSPFLIPLSMSLLRDLFSFVLLFLFSLVLFLF